MATRQSRNWKSVQPTSLRHALELCKEFARERRSMSVERLADALGLPDHFALYKWISTGRMPANLIRPYEAACGVTFVSKWLAVSSGKLLVDVPCGRKITDNDLAMMHSSFAMALQMLTELYSGRSDVEATMAALTVHIEACAWHRANVAQHATPELDFGGGEAVVSH